MSPFKSLFASSIALAIALAPTGRAAAGSGMDPALQARGKKAVDAGLAFLRKSAGPDGMYSKSVGVTAIVARAFLESHHGYREADGTFIARPIEIVLKHVQPDGSITQGPQNKNYITAVSMLALQSTHNPKYRKTIENAQKYVQSLQFDERQGRKPSDPSYGGIGYGDDEPRPDLSNQYMALSALRKTSADPKSAVWDKALKFISRCQNRSESNDQTWAGNDGGFTYWPGESEHAGTRSYGGMTHAGLISLLSAGADKKDPRVQAAYNWIRANYTLDENPGAADRSGLYYYYEVFAKSMAAYGDSVVVTKKGKRNWRNDYVAKMLALQNADGSWANADSPRWMEGDKNLTTARIVTGLSLALR